MMQVRLADDRIHVGERFSVSFQRTLRIPDDGGAYPLPPGLGMLPVRQIGRRFVVPMYQREAMWLAFHGEAWKPNAVKVGIGGVDAISGEVWSTSLHTDPQNYVVCPDQPWLDGINAGEGFIRQFVAMPLGSGYTVEGQLTGEEKTGGLQLVVFEPKPGIFPDTPPPVRRSRSHMKMSAALETATSMGLAAGGRMKQDIFRDTHGINTWDPTSATEVSVEIVNSTEFEAVSGEPPPQTPVTARTYTEYGLPWFELYDERYERIAGTSQLTRVRSTGQIDAASGQPSEEDRSVTIPDSQIRRIRRKPPKAR